MDTPNTDLGGLIERIKSDGIDEARKRSEEIIREADAEAARIIDAARTEADRMVEAAGLEAGRRETSGRKALELAARDALIQVRRSISDMFDSIIKREYGGAVSGEALAELILKLVQGWQGSGKGDADLEVLLSDADRKMLLDGFMSRLREDMKAGVELKVHPDIEKGFRIGEKGGHFHYDFSDGALAELLSMNLNGGLAEILKTAVQGETRE